MLCKTNSNFKAKQFNLRGVKKEEMQRRNEIQIQSMTVGQIYIRRKKLQTIEEANRYELSITDQRVIRRNTTRNNTLHRCGKM